MNRSFLPIACALLVSSVLSGRAEPFTLITIAGKAGLESLDGTNRSALFSYPIALAYGPEGDLYIADSGAAKVVRMRQVGTNWVTTTLAGGSPGIADGINDTARFSALAGIAVDSLTNIYVSDEHAIRKITPVGTNWVVTTWAGSPQIPGRVDGMSGRLNFPQGLAVDEAGFVYVADSGNHAIRRISPSRDVRTIAGTAGSYSPAPGSADGSGNYARFNGPVAVALDSATNIYVADTSNHTIRKITLKANNWEVSTLAGSALNSGSADGTNSTARLHKPSGISFSPGQGLVVADTSNHALRKVSQIGTNWVVTTLAGTAGIEGATDGTNETALFNSPRGLASGSAGKLFIADQHNSSIREAVPQGAETVVTTIAGDYSARTTDGPGKVSRFWQPNSIAVERPGKLFVADMHNHVIRHLTRSSSGWMVETILGKPGVPGTINGTNSTIRLNFPTGVALAPDGSLFITETDNHTIRQVARSGTNWISTTIAGVPGMPGMVDGTNSTARFMFPTAIAMNSAGELFVAEATRIRIVAREGTNWVVRSVPGYFSGPTGLAIDSEDNVYVSNSQANSIAKVARTGDTWTTITLAGPKGLLDGTNSTSRLSQPSGLAVDRSGVVYVLDRFNSCLRKFTPEGTNWIGTTLAGFAPQKGAADGNGADARLNWPYGLALDSEGTLYVADTGNSTIRMAWPTPELRIQEGSQQVTLSWPVTPIPYLLQAANSPFPEATWELLEGQAESNGYLMSIISPKQVTSRFFRLVLEE